MPNSTILPLTVPDIWRSSQNFKKIGHVTLLDPFGPNFAFISLVPLGMNLHAKFSVFSSKTVIPS